VKDGREENISRSNCQEHTKKDPEEVFGRVEEVKSRRELIKEKTLQKRRMENLQPVCV
jgi:hypothetical protein